MSVAATPTVQKRKEDDADRMRIRIKLRAYDHKIIDQSAAAIIDAVTRSGATVHGPIPLPTEKHIYSVLRATFVKKDAQDQFEMRIHKRLIDIIDPTPKTTDVLTNLNLPAGVDLEVKMI